METGEVSSPPETLKEQFVIQAQGAIEQYLPELDLLDRIRFDDYDPGMDRLDNGQQLWFHGPGEEDERPSVVFIIKKNGKLATTFYRSPFGTGARNHLFLPGGSVYNYGPKILKPTNVELATRTARHQMEGFQVDEDTQNLPFALDERGTPKTLRDVLLARIQELSGKSYRQQALLDWQTPAIPIFTSLNLHPDKTRELLLQRLRQQNPDRVGFTEDELDNELAKLDAHQEIVRVKAPHLERLAEFLE